MSVQKSIVLELFAILLMLYGGFLQGNYGLWILSFALLIGFVALVQGLLADR